MPTLCSAYNCKNRCPKAGVGFFGFPKNDPERRKQWIINMKWKDWNPQHHHRVCSDHFEERFIRRMNKRLHLVPGAVPTIFHFPESTQKKKAVIHPQSRRAGRFLNDELPGMQAGDSTATVAKCVTSPSNNATSEKSRLAKKAPEKVTSSSWYIHVDEEIQMSESLPGFFHSDYCLPHSIRWAFKDDVAPKVACENMDFELPPLKHVIEITEAWEWLGMDIRGPLPLTLNGHQYVLTLTDFYSKWVEAFPLRECSSTEVAQHIAEVLSHFGFPFGILVRLKRKFASKINLALNSELKLKGFSLLYRHRQVGSLDLATQILISRMVSDLLKDHLENWDVCLPAKVFSMCFSEHPKTHQRPFTLLCCQGPQPVTTPRDLSFSPAELRETSFAVKSNLEGANEIDTQEMVAFESGKETPGKNTTTRISFLRINTDSNAGLDAPVGGGLDDALDGTGGGPDPPSGGGPDAASGGGDPDAASGGGDPDAASGGGDPDAASGGGGPDAASGGGGPDAASGGGGPDAASGGGGPDAASGGGGGPDASLGGGGPDNTLGGGSEMDTCEGTDAPFSRGPDIYQDSQPDGCAEGMIGIESVTISFLSSNADCDIHPESGTDVQTVSHPNSISNIESNSNCDLSSEHHHAMEY
ncbi:hypothetical protein UPYG_G00105800 [Umbra pygmaea]|uniref:THAP domain-containing protein 1 n=1 Tax=Umbra pygmaea TaxID=75934 RepID=A0ABD0XM56_UMBPY